MKDAKTLMLEVLAAIPDGKKVASLFSEDGAFELPFLYSVGIEPRHKGHDAIEAFFDLVKQIYPDFGFKPENIHILIETPEQVFAEYTAHVTAAQTGRKIHHHFAGRLVAEDGKIKLLRESLNVVAAAQALNPNGLADLPAFDAEIHSVKPGYQS